MFKKTLIALLLFGIASAQLLGSRAPSSRAETWYANSVFYQVFVRSFQDSNGDGKGDLAGLTSRLDYLKDLGINALWLNPIHPSPSYHGYDITDYQGINPDFGTLEDFKVFLAAAKARGIRVILDYVPNHTARSHPWFLNALAGGDKKSWYNWRDQNPGWKQPWVGGNPAWHPVSSSKTEYYYGVFWEGMPDLNWRNANVREAMFAAAKYWLELGVDGFRVDAPRYLFEETDGNTPDTQADMDWQTDFTQFVKGIKADATVVSEIWTNTETVAKYFQNGTGQKMGFNFDLGRAVRETANRANPGAVQQVLARVASSYPKEAVDAIFTSNHDLERMKFFNAGRYRSAAAMLLTLPGTPFIYYGEEIGMPNAASSRDEAKRTPMRWSNGAFAGFSSVQPWQLFSSSEENINVAAQQKAGSLWTLYKNLIRIRQANPALRVGGYEPINTGNDRVFAFTRAYKDQKIAVVINLDSDPQVATLSTKKTLLELGGTVRELTHGKNLAAMKNNYQVKLSPYGFVLLEVR